MRSQELSHAELESTQFSKRDLQDFFAVLNENKFLDRPLFYKGFLCSLRPFQIANHLGSMIFLFDPYLDQSTLGSLDHYVKDLSILKNQDKVWLLPNEYVFLDIAKNNSPCSFFLDLTYYRTSLFVNFGKSVIEYGNFRQSLKSDLTHLYHFLNGNSLLFGNMRDNDYVREVLEMFAKENDLVIGTQGSFWFVFKK